MKKIGLLFLLAALLAAPLLDLTAQGGQGRGRNNRGNRGAGCAQQAYAMTADDEQKALEIFNSEEKEALADLKVTDAREYYRTLRRANMQAQGLCVYQQDGTPAYYGRGRNNGVCPYVNQ